MRRHLSHLLFATLIVVCLTVRADAGADEAADGGLRDLRALYNRPAETPFPDDNPYSAAKAELGSRLFSDRVLSRSGTQSCMSCHMPERAWGDGKARGLGDRGQPMALRSPTLLDMAWTSRLGWDGKFRDVEAVVFAAISGAANMDLPEEEALARLSARPGYIHAFAAVFGDGPITRRNVELALATYERTIVSGEAPFDRWIAGDEAAISPEAKRGFALFNGRARCSACHSGWSFTDGSFHDIGTAEGDDIGRGQLFPGSVALRYAFKTPTLRGVLLRAPYMHDGSIESIEGVIELYDRGGIQRPSRSPLLGALGMTRLEKTDLVAFLKTLTAVTASPSGGAAP